MQLEDARHMAIDEFAVPILVTPQADFDYLQFGAGIGDRLAKGLPVLGSARGLHCSRPTTNRRAENAGEHDRQDAGKKDPVEGAGAADRSDRRPQSLDSSKVEQVSPDQRAKRATDVSERAGVPSRQNQGDSSRRKRRHENRKGDAEDRKSVV